MKTLLKLILALLTGGACLSSLAAQIRAHAQLDTSNIMIGDQVGLHIQIETPAGVKLLGIRPNGINQTPTLEIVKKSKVDTLALSPNVLVEQVIMLTSFKEGKYFVPSIPIEYTEGGVVKTVYTDSLPLLVRTIPNVSDTTQIRPIKNIWREHSQLSDILPYLLAIAGLIGIIILLIRLRKRPKVEPIALIIPPKPIHEIILEKLEALEKSDLLFRRDYNAYQTRLSYILREYLEVRFSMQALESTTEEIVRDFFSSGVPFQWQSILQKLMQEADLVKFAKAEIPSERHQEALKTVRAFVEETKIIDNQEPLNPA
jgi:hypothetical protein